MMFGSLVLIVIYSFVWLSIGFLHPSVNLDLFPFFLFFPIRFAAFFQIGAGFEKLL